MTRFAEPPFGSPLEEGLREQAELFDMAPDALVMVDLCRMAIVQWNAGAEALYGWDRAAAMERNLDELVGTQYPLPEDDLLAEFLRTGRWEGEVVQTCRDGRQVVVATRWALKRDAEGRAVRLLASNRDVTAQHLLVADLRRARQEAEHASAAKSAFLAVMSHELRTPLNAVIGFGELLSDQADELGERAWVEDLGKITGAGRRLLAMIEGMLDLAMLEGGVLPVAVEPFRPAEELQAVLDEGRREAQAHGNRFELAVASDLPVMCSDARRIAQVAGELLANAAKFTNRGTIRVTLARAGDPPWLTLTVEDDGVGIEPAFLPSLFEPFVQAEPASTRHHDGPGIGLAIAARLCRVLGGELQVRSQPGRGSRFEARFPAIAPAAGTSVPAWSRRPSLSARTREAYSGSTIDDEESGS